jgi:TonB family protein
LLIYENGKEVFRLPSSPGQAEQPANRPGSESTEGLSDEPKRAVELTPTAAEDGLLYRVEPGYPEEARQQQIQGAVVLDVHIGTDGGVQEVTVVSGNPLLARSATDAVKQWRFKRHQVEGRAVEMQTRITLNFRLPQ